MLSEIRNIVKVFMRTKTQYIVLQVKICSKGCALYFYSYTSSNFLVKWHKNPLQVRVIGCDSFPGREESGVGWGGGLDGPRSFSLVVCLTVSSLRSPEQTSEQKFNASTLTKRRRTYRELNAKNNEKSLAGKLPPANSRRGEGGQTDVPKIDGVRERLIEAAIK